jgi:type III restriction enzyme
MKNLHQILYSEIERWRKSGYQSQFSEVVEILKFNKNESKYLRTAQFNAIETYLFLRFVKETPKIIDLYKEYFKNLKDFVEVLGIKHIKQDNIRFLKTLDDVLKDLLDPAVAQYKYDTLTETLNLDYPSYILALAMGSGKTNIISAIIAIEFAIAIANENKKSEFNFIKNALVFAPGLTILKNSLKNIALLPFAKILPPHLLNSFLANVKYIFAGDTDRLLVVQKESQWNVIVSNSEKLILRNKKERIQTEFNFTGEKREQESNARLERIKSLPSLAIFSDEAHHTYGNKIGEDLKKVRATINHLYESSNIVCVINTTGTPYTKTQMLKDVVFWYGLEEGIKDGILKSLENGILQYSLKNNEEEEIAINEIIRDFFAKYKQGFEKIAFYFKHEEHLELARKSIEKVLAQLGMSSNIILKNTQKSSNKEVQTFLNLDADHTKRIILLIEKGKEGWDCKTLFATALISEVSSSNNYVLQASTRCLRYLEDNKQNATIYISASNAKILNKELEDNYDTNLNNLNKTPQEKLIEQKIELKKYPLPKIEFKIKTRKIARIEHIDNEQLELTLPTLQAETTIYKDIGDYKDNRIIDQGNSQIITATQKISLLLASYKIALKYHLKAIDILKILQTIYNNQDEMPLNHLQALYQQIDQQKQSYEEIEEVITQVRALIRTEDGFIKNAGDKYYYHTLRFKENSKQLGLLTKNNTNSQYGFHYEPYNFDVQAERDFFNKILGILTMKREQIEDIYFTGGLTNPKYTDFYFEYKAEDNKYHKYYPDFLIKKKSGELYIIEIKSKSTLEDTTLKDKKKAVEEIARINENKIKYSVLYASGAEINKEELEYREIINFIKQ